MSDRRVAGMVPGLTDEELRADPVPVTGVVTTGGLTDAELRVTPVDVVGPLTDAELRDSAVPVIPAGPDGRPLDQDERIDDATWKRLLLDELRAVRIGIQYLLDNTPTRDIDLLAEAQSQREELEN